MKTTSILILTLIVALVSGLLIGVACTLLISHSIMMERDYYKTQFTTACNIATAEREMLIRLTGQPINPINCELLMLK